MITLAKKFIPVLFTFFLAINYAEHIACMDLPASAERPATENIATSAEQPATLDECSICREQLPSSIAAASAILTLNCKHQTHKVCSEKYYRGQILEKENVALLCTLCRHPLDSEDLQKLDQAISLEDTLTFLKARVAPLLMNEQNMYVFEEAFSALSRVQQLNPTLKHQLELLRLHFMLFARHEINRNMAAAAPGGGLQLDSILNLSPERLNALQEPMTRLLQNVARGTVREISYQISDRIYNHRRMILAISLAFYVHYYLLPIIIGKFFSSH